MQLADLAVRHAEGALAPKVIGSRTQRQQQDKKDGGLGHRKQSANKDGEKSAGGDRVAGPRMLPYFMTSKAVTRFDTVAYSSLGSGIRPRSAR